MKRLILWLISRWAKDPEIKDLVLDISGQTDLDRYRDFRVVFGTDAGKRVLNQILKWGHLYQSSMSPNPNDVIFAEGERNLALKILAGLTVPAERPTQQRGKQ